MFHREPLIAGSAARLEDLVTRIREVKIHSIYLRTKLATASTCLTLQATSVYTKKQSSVRNKLRLALACSLIFLLSTMASGPIFAQASPTTTSNGTCASSLISSGSQAAAASISQAQAKSASASSLAANDAGYNASFSSIFYRLRFTSSCSVYLENVNVVYVLVKGNAAVYTLEISLNPGPTAVLNTTEYPAHRLVFRPGRVGQGTNTIILVGYHKAGLAIICLKLRKRKAGSAIYPIATLPFGLARLQPLADREE